LFLDNDSSSPKLNNIVLHGSYTEIILTLLCMVNFLVSYIFLVCFSRQGYQTSFPSPVAKVDLIRYQSPYLKQSSCGESRKWQNEWLDYNEVINVDLSVQSPVLIDEQGPACG